MLRAFAAPYLLHQAQRLGVVGQGHDPQQAAGLGAGPFDQLVEGSGQGIVKVGQFFAVAGVGGKQGGQLGVVLAVL